MTARRGLSPFTVMIVLCLLPLILFYVLAMSGIAIHPILIAAILVICCLAMFYLMAGCKRHRLDDRDAPGATRQVEPPLSIPADTTDVFEVMAERRAGDAIVIEGDLKTEPDEAYETLKERFAGTEMVPMLQEDDRGWPSLLLLPRSVFTRQRSTRGPVVNLVLFLATFLTTTWAGALHQGVNLLEEPSRFAEGLPYSLALIVILGAHELGHYFAARSHGMDVSLPYFIPVPFALGTFGAFIQLRSPAENRRALFDMAVAGPLAGLVFAIPALYFGLQQSEVLATTESAGILHHGASVGSSALLAGLAKLSIGEALAEGHVLALHPMAFAGWLGLIVTALNLLPIGQLDGGHIADAMFGSRTSAAISMAAMLALFALGLFVWSGLLFWAFIVYFIAGRKGLPPLNNVSRLDPRRRLVGWFAFAVLMAILLPVPHSLYESLGIHCPYV